jgi:polyhydroxyalkanoate synthase subunit PhaC
MTDATDTASDPLEHADELAKNLAQLTELSQRVTAELMKRQSARESVDPLNVSQAFVEATAQWLSNPPKAMAAQIELWQHYVTLWQNVVSRSVDNAAEPLLKPAPGDRRFRDPDWDANPVFDFIKQSYLLAARSLQKHVREIEGLDAQTAQKVDFYTRQFVDAMSPSNFIFTNPEVLRATIDSKGENLVRGMHNLLADLDRNKGELIAKMTDLDAFEVGRNVGVTPGKVIFQNELIQLIQYEPTTETVFRRPLLMVPPWINKFYILDLRPDNSFIKWCVDQGYTVFVISWVNPDESLGDKTFEDYVFDGPLAALDAIEAATGEREVSCIGYCIGGTLMSTALGYMAATGDDRIQACTMFAAQVDFSDAGELTVFIDEEQISYIERRMERRGGLLDASAMASAFNLLRANDLIWSFMVNNYLLGREPLPFDLLFWNSDATRIPAKMHSFYLRNMYQRNQLVQPGAIAFRGVPIDLSKVTIPMYLQAAKDDHIVPYRSVFKATKVFSGPVRFMLAGSGHIAGVVNPPAANKYQHWTNDAEQRFESVEDWLAMATEHPGSWWPEWHVWLSGLSGEQVPARAPGSGALPAIEDAPGSYVKVRS